MFQYKSVQTPLIKINEFCKKFNLPNLLVKDESQNPFGTWKDRRSNLITEKAKHNFVNKLCLITSGNSGFSLAKFAGKTDIKIVCIIDKNLSNSIKKSLKEICYKIIEVDLSEKILKTEEVIALARENDKEVIWDVTNGFQQAYEPIIKEIKNFNPDYLICPIGSGEAFAGLYDGIKKYKLKVKLIGVKPKSNPSFADKLYTKWTPYEVKIKSILENGNEIVELTEEEIKSAYIYTKDYM